MTDILEFDVAVEKTKTYRITREEFDRINKEFDLKLSFDNLSKDDLETLYFELDDFYVYDINHKDSTILGHDYY